jgi:hypothetical protein
LAYCLMGIFDVNMPIIYGEGKKAFLRLQEEIIKTSDDESIFAWCSPDPDYGLLAPSVTAFRESGDIQTMTWGETEIRPPYSMTNHGLELYLPLTSFGTQWPPEEALLQLNCVRKGRRITLHLVRTAGGWRRKDCSELFLSDPLGQNESTNLESPYHLIHVRQNQYRTNGPTQISSTPGLPVGWERRHTPNGRAYYVNHRTRTTQWHSPQ